MTAIPRSGFFWFRLWCVLLLTHMPLVSDAATPVSGSISVNTTWANAQGPFLLSGDVTIDSGATLTIEPGTLIYFDQNANLIVANGALSAKGTATDPILFTSKLEPSSTATPGSWGQIRFLNATNDAATLLEYVTIRYGQGVVMLGAAPTLNYTTISDNAGAAILIDLNASPTGHDNHAFNNQLNGISVPTGEILANTVWGLTGIPYVIDSGVLHIGAAPTVTSVTPNQIEQGQTVAATITGSRLTGVEQIVFGAPQVTAQVNSGGSATSIPVTITAAASAPEANIGMDVQVAAGRIHLDSAISVVYPMPKIDSISPTVVYSNRGYSSFQINGRNFDTTSVVLLDGVELPTTYSGDRTKLLVNLPPQTQGDKVLRVRSADTRTTGAYVFSNLFAVTVQTPAISLTPTSLTTRVNTTQPLHIAIPFAAGTGGLAVSLASSDATVAAVPASVLIAEGSSSVDVTLSGATTGTTTITASASGFASGTTSLTVLPEQSISLTPSTTTMSKGTTITARATLSLVAPAGGIALTFSSSNTSVISVTNTVLVPEGSKTAQFTINALDVGLATITASAAGFSDAQLAVTSEFDIYPIPNPLAVLPDGVQHQFFVHLSKPESVARTFTLTVVDPTIATISPSTITFAPGQTDVPVSITGIKAGSTRVTIGSLVREIVINVTTEAAAADFTPGALLGVIRGDAAYPPIPTASTPTTTRVLGVTKGDVTLPQTPMESGPTTSPIIGVTKGDTTLPHDPIESGPTTSPVLGVTKGDTTWPLLPLDSGPTLSPLLGVKK